MNFVKSIQGKGGGASKVSITCIFINSEALLMIFCIIFLLMKLYELILGALVSYCYIQTDIFLSDFKFYKIVTIYIECTEYDENFTTSPK